MKKVDPQPEEIEKRLDQLAEGLATIFLTYAFQINSQQHKQNGK